MKKLLILVAFVSMFAQETTHGVKEGDTLWDIAGYYYQNPFLWPYVWRANLAQIEDPHWIYPEQQFVIPPSPEQGLTALPPEETGYAPPVAAPPPTPVDKEETEVISVVTPEPKLFSAEMMHRVGVVVADMMEPWARIIGTEPADQEMITAYKITYIDRSADLAEGDMLTVYRPGQTLKHPRTGDVLGEEVIMLGIVEIEAVGAEGSRCKVRASYDIMKKGDFLMPYEAVEAVNLVELVETEQDIEAYVVDLRTMHQMAPPHVFVYIDQGEMTGAAVGDVYAVYHERKVDGKEMPDFDIGKIQIVKVFEKVSIGMLLRDREPIPIKRGEKCRLMMEAR
jgi:hypothetical protein